LGYLQQLRVETAKRLLEDGIQTFNEITYLVGYEDIPFFSKCSPPEKALVVAITYGI